MYDPLHDEPIYDMEDHDDRAALVRGGQGRSPEEVIQAAIGGAVFLVLVVVVCLKGCF